MQLFSCPKTDCDNAVSSTVDSHVGCPEPGRGLLLGQQLAAWHIEGAPQGTLGAGHLCDADRA